MAKFNINNLVNFINGLTPDPRPWRIYILRLGIKNALNDLISRTITRSYALSGLISGHVSGRFPPCGLETVAYGNFYCGTNTWKYAGQILTL